MHKHPSQPHLAVTQKHFSLAIHAPQLGVSRSSVTYVYKASLSSCSAFISIIQISSSHFPASSPPHLSRSKLHFSPFFTDTHLVPKKMKSIFASAAVLFSALAVMTEAHVSFRFPCPRRGPYWECPQPGPNDWNLVDYDIRSPMGTWVC